MLAEPLRAQRIVAALLHPWRAWGVRGGLRESGRHAACASRGTSMAAHDDDPTPLLTRRMVALHLDPDDVRHAEPAMFGELQALCGRCESQGECGWTLLHDSADPAWQEWRNYCPNSAKLRMLSALRGCCFEADGA